MDTDQESEWILSEKLDELDPDKATNKVVHATIKKVGDDIESLNFNTAISQMMVCTNELTKLDPSSRFVCRHALALIEPVCTSPFGRTQRSPG